MNQLKNIHIDVLQEALLVALRDKYVMPNNWSDYQKKYELLQETHSLIETLRTNEPINF